MSQRVDTEGGLLNEEDSKNPSVDKSTEPITPSQTGNETRKDQSHDDDGFDIIPMLPHDDGVFVQIRNIRTTDPLWILFHDHPTKVRIQETLSNRIRILVGIGISMMSTMIPRPPSD